MKNECSNIATVSLSLPGYLSHPLELSNKGMKKNKLLKTEEKSLRMTLTNCLNIELKTMHVSLF